MRRLLVPSALALSLGLLAPEASADPTLRVQIDARGDFLMFGNSSAYECGNDELLPIVGDTTACPPKNQPNQADSSPDLFWQDDTLSAVTDADTARTTAVLDVPPGATVLYARLYWAGYKAGTGGADTAILLEQPSGSLSTTVTADGSSTVDSAGNIWYQSTAEITDLILANGEGAYRVGGIASLDLRGINDNNPMLAWVAVVFYQLDSEPARNLALFDGLTQVPVGFDAQVSIGGFFVPNAGFDAKLGVIAYEGEDSLVGDALEFNGTALFDAVNPVDNFFNSSRSALGAPVSLVGDLPQLSGDANSTSGVDMDVIDVTSELTAGDTAATVRATSAGDAYLLGAFVTSISTFKPDYQTSSKTFEDNNGGSVKPGDVLTYTIVSENTGNDTAIDTVLTDVLPAGLSYVPGTLELDAASLSDDPGDDEGEYDAASGTLTVRLGTGATASQGGQMAPGETTSVTFDVSVDAGTIGSILNQAMISAAGELGAPVSDFPTDGEGTDPGPQPTEVIVDGCDQDADCGTAAPICDLGVDPKVCVECLSDADCTSEAEPDCLADKSCGCAAGDGKCGGAGGAGGEPGQGGSGGGEGGSETGGSSGTAGSSGHGGAFGGSTNLALNKGTLEGGGCSCRAVGTGDGSLAALIASLCGIFALGRRRARRSS